MPLFSPPMSEAASHAVALRVAIVAGEESGDALGAGLIDALRERVGEVAVCGVGGPRMGSAGLDSLYPMSRLSVMGLVEALGRYPGVIRMRRRLARQLIDAAPDVFVGIDAPDFNLGLERMLKDAGIPTVHYVSPQVWAWRKYRLPKIARAVDRVLALFPFEETFYREHQVPVSYVGHPLADRIELHADRHAARAALSLDPHAPIVALLPGSRYSEVRHLARPLIETARWLLRRRPQMRFVLPPANDITRVFCEREIVESGEGLPLTMLANGSSRTAMCAADAVLLASGTATLEAMLLKRPMVVTYRTNPLTYRIMKAMFHVDCVSLPNLLAGRVLVPELLQVRAVARELGPAVLGQLEDSSQKKDMLETFERLHRELRRGADARAAEAVLGVASSNTTSRRPRLARAGTCGV